MKILPTHIALLFCSAALMPLSLNATSNTTANVATSLPAQPIVSEQQAINAVFNRIEQHDKTIVVDNRHHRATFDKDGVHFSPTQGPNWHWQIKHTKSVAPVLNKRVVEYIHPHHTERYLLKAQTIEQRFIIDKPYRGKNDLVIEGVINSAGNFSQTDTGWRWHDATGAVNLGQVTVFDASGTILPATMHTTATHSRITVAASDLHSAHYPVTIDPEIGSDTRLSDMGPDGDANFVAFNPAVAYNASNNEYLVVWRGDDNTGSLVDEENEIYGQRVNGATGAEIGSDIRLSDMGPDGDPDFDAFDPAVAYNASNNEYLVVWRGDDNTGSLVDGEREIYGQRVNAATGEEIGSDTRLSDMGSDGDTNFNAFYPAVAYNASNNEYLVVWYGDDNTGSLVDDENEIFGQRVNAATGAEIGSDIRLSDMGPDGDATFAAFDPAVAYNASNNEYLVVWTGDDNTGSLVNDEFETFGQRVNGATGAEIGSDIRLSDMGPDGDPDFDAFNPAVAYNASNNEYLVVWNGGDDTGSLVDDELETFGQRVNGATGVEIGSDTRLSDMGPDGDPNFDALNPAVAYNASNNEYWVVWNGDDNTGSLVNNEQEIFGQRFTGPATLRFASATSSVNENDGSVQITVQRVGDTSNTVTVDFTTANGTATAPADYTAANGTLTFNAGETGKTFAIAISDNSDTDGDKTVNLSLSNAQANSGDVTLDNQSAASVLTIVDDESVVTDDESKKSGGGGSLNLMSLFLVMLLLSLRRAVGARRAVPLQR